LYLNVLGNTGMKTLGIHDLTVMFLLIVLKVITFCELSKEEGQKKNNLKLIKEIIIDSSVNALINHFVVGCFILIFQNILQFQIL